MNFSCEVLIVDAKSALEITGYFFNDLRVRLFGKTEFILKHVDEFASWTLPRTALDLEWLE